MLIDFMKEKIMKKLIVAMAVICFAVAAAIAAGPAKIDLKTWVAGEPSKPAVQFPHDVHQAKNACTDCHVTEEGGALKNLKAGGEVSFKGAIGVKKTKNDAHDLFCWECHVTKKVPQGKSCNKCHAK
jgi:hypothetical protein